MNYRCLLPFVVILFSCTNLSHLPKEERTERSEHFYREAIIASGNKNFDKALSLFQKAAQYDSANTSAFCGIAEILILQERFSDAEKVLLNAPAVDSNYSTYYFLLGQSQFHLKEINAAILNLERSIRQNPDHAEANFMLAQLYYQVDNFGHALSALETLLKNMLIADREKINSFYVKVRQEAAIKAPNLFFETRVSAKIAESKKITRGEFAFYLATQLNAPKPNDPVIFEDVDLNDSMLIYYQKAVASGILEKLPDKKFRSEYVMKRRSMAFYLFELIKQNKIPVSSASHAWNDVPAEDLQSEAVNAVYQLDLMIPKSQSVFGADDFISGSELAAAVKKLKVLIGK